MEKPQIDYPCQWPYRVIGSDEQLMRARIADVLEAYAFRIGDGNVSRKGTYCSVHVEVTVAREEERNEIFRKLRTITGVRMVF